MINTVTINDILAVKEQRQVRQDFFRQKYDLPIVSITVITPGNIKDTLRARQIFNYTANSVRERLRVVAEEHVYTVAGPEGLLAVHGDPAEIKNITMSIEEEYAFGRLLDLDVFDRGGILLSRKQGRNCLICSERAVVCMREKRHRNSEVQLAVEQLLNQFSAYQTRNISPAAEKLGALAVEAMLYEVAATPAPGLVDRLNSGAHQDMDFYSFMQSSAALSTTIARCAQAGLEHKRELSSLLPILRYIGKDGERAMLEATNGVNTQKGILFSLGIVVAAAGWLYQHDSPLTPNVILDTTAQIVKGIVANELTVNWKKPAELTAGERLYRSYGITGIRGEMERGLPAIRYNALPALTEALKAGLGANNSLIQALLVLFMYVDDTTVMNRHSPDKMKTWIRPRVQEILQAGGMYTVSGRSMVSELDQEFIAHNVSPGGAADMLAVTWFIYKVSMVEKRYEDEKSTNERRNCEGTS